MLPPSTATATVPVTGTPSGADKVTLTTGRAPTFTSLGACTASVGVAFLTVTCTVDVDALCFGSPAYPRVSWCVPGASDVAGSAIVALPADRVPDPRTGSRAAPSPVPVAVAGVTVAETVPAVP